MSFNQHKLRDAIHHPRDISSDTVTDMESTVAKYPYFQLLHTLIAKAKHDQQTADAYQALGKAAVYAPDRRVLRQVFYDDIALTGSPASEEGSADTVPPTDAAVGETTAPETAETDASADTADHVVLPPPKDDASKELREELASTLQILEDSKEQLPDSNPDDEAVTAPEVPAGDVKLPLDDEATDEEPSAKTESQTEQHEIIDKFVKANPSINRDKLPPSDQESDLAAGSTAMQDDLVTENLAEIMVKQGKEDKAIDIYQKLVLKYPEKKAYFAQKIEQLKNN